MKTADLRLALEETATGRAHAYIVLGAYAGLRVHEIAKVHARDIDIVERTIRVGREGRR